MPTRVWATDSEVKVMRETDRQTDRQRTVFSKNGAVWGVRGSGEIY